MTKETDQNIEQNENLDSDCLEAFDHVYAYINNELTDEDALVRVEYHLSHCKSCYSRSEMERKINEKMKNSRSDKAPEHLQKRLQNLIDDF